MFFLNALFSTTLTEWALLFFNDQISQAYSRDGCNSYCKYPQRCTLRLML